MQIAWADVVRNPATRESSSLRPGRAGQTVEEAEKIGVSVNYCRDDSDVRNGINITNYDRIHKFDCGQFSGVVLDESSIIKHHAAKTLQSLLDAFRVTPFKLCATATPAPNDWSWATMPSFWAFGRRCWPSSSFTTAATRRHGGSRVMRGICSGGGLRG